MARQTKYQKDAYKKKLVEYGLSIINSGHSNVTMRELSRLSNVSIGTVYNIFPSYDNFVFHVKSVILERLLECFLTPDLSKKNFQKSINELTHIFFNYINENNLLWNFLISTQTPSKSVPDWYQEKICNILDAISKEFKKIPNISTEKIELSAIIFWSNLQGLALIKEHQKLDLVTSQTYEKIIDTFVESYLNGITVEKES